MYQMSHVLPNDFRIHTDFNPLYELSNKYITFSPHYQPSHKEVPYKKTP